MRYLTTCDSPFSLEDLAARIRRSSNFRFEWQFYQFSGIDPQSPAGIGWALESIIATRDLHRFLRDSYVANDDEAFEINPLHEHCQFVAPEGEFEDILARAAGDHLGAYSREVLPAIASEGQEIKESFGRIGDYWAYQLWPGDEPGCSTCREYNHHLFCTWFYGVAWDYCLFAAWPDHGLLWMGCLTDTD